METKVSTAAWNMVSEIEVIYKSKVKPSLRPQVKTPTEAYELFRLHWDENKIELQEQFAVMFLNRAKRVLGIYLTSTGGITGTVADPRLIVGAALKLACCYIILAHSHPSGNLKPSNADIELTRKIKCGAALLDIMVIDHIILTSEGHLSFSEEGLL